MIHICTFTLTLYPPCPCPCTCHCSCHCHGPCSNFLGIMREEHLVFGICMHNPVHSFTTRSRIFWLFDALAWQVHVYTCTLTLLSHSSMCIIRLTACVRPGCL